MLELLENLKANIRDPKAKTLIQRCSEMDFTSLIMNRIFFLTFNLDLYNYYKGLVLQTLLKEESQDIDHHPHFQEAATLVEFISEDDKRIMSDICNSILISEIKKAKNQEEIIKWLEISSYLRTQTGNELSCINFAYIYFTSLMYGMAWKLRTQPTAKEIRLALYYLYTAQSFKLDVNSLVSALGNTAIEFIQASNGLTNPDQKKDSEKVQEGYYILKDLSYVNRKHIKCYLI
jgi:hypothetical protein